MTTMIVMCDDRPIGSFFVLRDWKHSSSRLGLFRQKGTVFLVFNSDFDANPKGTSLTYKKREALKSALSTRIHR